MKAMIFNVLASCLFISMSLEVDAIDQRQTAFQKHQRLDVQQPVGQLSLGAGQGFAKNKGHSNSKYSAVVKHREKMLREQAVAQQHQKNEGRGANMPKGHFASKSSGQATGLALVAGQPKGDHAYGAMRYKQDREKEGNLIRRIKQIEGNEKRTAVQDIYLKKLRAQLKQLNFDAIKHRSILLQRFYGKYFSKDDDQIEFKLPARPLKNCMLQAMVDPSFSPSCKPDRTYSEKQCTRKRCWCSTKTGTMQSKYKQGGLHGHGFYYGIKGLKLRCPRN